MCAPFRRIAARECAGFVGLALWFAAVAATSRAADAPMADARPGLKFSAQPTVQEISRAGMFESPLVLVGGEPGAEENAALAAALQRYWQRAKPDDFASLTGFLEEHPRSVWRAALLTGLGFEYYNGAYYSRALAAWEEAWALGQRATNAAGKFLADRAVCELAGLYSRLGRMTELEALLKSIEQRVFIGGAVERINLAREALFLMQSRPEISFRCGPLALQCVRRSLDPQAPMEMEIFNSASTQQGFSLPQVAELSKKVGLNYQMAHRSNRRESAPSSKSELSQSGLASVATSDGMRGDFIIPSVVHWKAGHYAALTRRVGDRYLLEDPTFGNSVWATRQALEDETSGYFLIPPGDLPPGWRSVDAKEGAAIWGKGVTSNNDPDVYTPDDLYTGCEADGMGMAVSRVHLMLANLNISDTPVGYAPPVGPPVRFTVRYNHRDHVQPFPPGTVFISVGFGPNWTHDWKGRIRDNPNNPLADVKYFVGGGGARTFTGFNTNTQTFASQQYDQTLLKRIGDNPFTSTYELIHPDGSKKVFGRRASQDGQLTQVVDAAGNAVTLDYDAQSGDLVSLTDALGQVTTISYEHPENGFLITKVTDPFGRFATFEYETFNVPIQVGPPPTPPLVIHVQVLSKITDVLGLVSEFKHLAPGSIQRMITPYGTNTFSTGQSGNTRWVETLYPDGSRDRVEYSQATNHLTFSEPANQVPQGMSVFNQWLFGRNTYYWSRNASATAHGDYSKAKIFHWLHTADIAVTAGVLESVKEPLEGRVWYNYPGQSFAGGIGSSSRPTRIGRVLDDGSTQLYSYAYNGFGHLTSSVDPMGRTLSYIYATNGIDLLEIRQTRAGNNELLASVTYNHQHRPLTVTDAAGQTTTFTYNARGQPLTETNPKGETITYTYNANGYLIAVDGPLPGAGDTATATYDAFGRPRTLTDESGYTLTLDYDALNRIVKVTYPDATFDQFTHDRLDLVTFRDRAGRQTFYEYDNMRQVRKQTDPLGRVTHFQWCSCGDIKSLTDPLGRTTEWHTDVQGRLTRKQYGDGSQVNYVYESAGGRLRQIIDEKQQILFFAYNRDNTLQAISYANAAIPTPGVSYTYDPDYQRVASLTDGTGTTLYSYHPITGTPTLGAGQLASVDGPLPDDTITYGYDELGRRISTAINGMASVLTYDAAGRLIGETNALGSFAYGYDGGSSRLVSQSHPNGQTGELSYGNNLQDRLVQRITHKVGATPVSEFLYGRDVPAQRITTWSQQVCAQPPDLYTFGYDAANQLLTASITNAGTLVNTFAYTYDPAGNRLLERAGATTNTATYNALNQISTTTAPSASRTNEWDAKDCLIAASRGNQRVEFAYDSFNRLASLRWLTNGVEISFRRFVWHNRELREERDGSGTVTKRYFSQGMKLETGPAAGNYYYTRDHLGSIRELTDSNGNVRARYIYDPWGRRIKLAGDLDADLGFAGMFWSPETSLSLTRFRAYDPELGRWLTRDPLNNAEISEGPNLYAYVVNNPVNYIDPEGLAVKPCLTTVDCACLQQPELCAAIGPAAEGVRRGVEAIQRVQPAAARVCQTFSTFETRFAALKTTYEQHAPTLMSEYQAWLQTRPLLDPRILKDLPIWTTEMIHLDRQLFDLAQFYATRHGISFQRAWDILANRLGFNPDHW